MSAPESSDQLEVEWQFDAPSAARVAAWLETANVPGYTVRTVATKQLHDTYYDTPDWRLHRAGFTCRVRHKPDGAELTLKSMAEAKDGIRSRREMTEKLTGEPPHAPGPCGAMIRLIVGKRPLMLLFPLQQVRRTFELSDSAGVLAEIAADETAVGSAETGGTAELKRIEVEVEAGGVQRAQRFVDVLIAAGELVPGRVSKFEAALAASGLSPTAADAGLGSKEINASMTATQVAYAIMRKHFGVFLANEPGTRLGDDIEALHDMRVAARRLRAAMQAFRPWLPERSERFRAELGWVAAALGVVRDLNVQIERMEEWRADASEAEAKALDAVEAILGEQRERGRKRMLAVLDQRRYDLLVERFSVFLRRGPPARGFPAGEVSILEVAPRLVEKRYKRVRRGGDPINRTSPPDDYHALRIETKKLRYALEFVGSIYGKPATDFAAQLTLLQDLLGLHQDAEVAMDTLRELAKTNARRLGPEAVLTMGAIAERYRRHAAELRAGYPKRYAPIRGANWTALRKTLVSRRPVAPADGH